jgi:glutamate---cysteine ligase / carboxylate-amine ligase
MDIDDFTIGVEEEFFLVDATTRELRPRAEHIVESATAASDEQIEMELNLAQIETATPVCASLEEVAENLRSLRCSVSVAAREHDSRVVALGTHPFSEWMGQQITPKARYEELEAEYQRLAWEQLVCGCHVHVCIPDRDVAIRVMDRVRPWLPILRAMTVNSPYWEGVDTGYASYRTEIFDRWPMTGIPPELGSEASFDELVEALVATEAVPDASKIYWDVRPASRFDTLEFRVADVCATVDEAVLLAGLARSLVRRCYADVVAEVPVPTYPMALLEAARWRAARYGLSGTLVDLEQRRTRPAPELVHDLLAYLRPDLEDAGEWELIERATATLLRIGTGTARQRRTFEQHGLRGVVDEMVAATDGTKPYESWSDT